MRSNDRAPFAPHPVYLPAFCCNDVSGRIRCVALARPPRRTPVGTPASAELRTPCACSRLRRFATNAGRKTGLGRPRRGRIARPQAQSEPEARALHALQRSRAVRPRRGRIARPHARSRPEARALHAFQRSRAVRPRRGWIARQQAQERPGLGQQQNPFVLFVPFVVRSCRDGRRSRSGPTLRALRGEILPPPLLHPCDLPLELAAKIRRQRTHIALRKLRLRHPAKLSIRPGHAPAPACAS